MNSEQLEALLIDQALGELPEDVSALLDAYLAAHPEEAQKAQSTQDALQVTKNTMEAHPELLSDTAEAAGKTAIAPMLAALLQNRILQAACVILLAGGIGFVLGQFQSGMDAPIVVQEEPEPLTESPWAQYQAKDLSLVLANLQSR